MSLNIIPVPLFLEPEDVKIGRFVANVDQPLQGFYDPVVDNGPKQKLTEFSYSGSSDSKRNATSTLKMILSTKLSRSKGSEITIAPTQGRYHLLENSDDWFYQVTAQDATRRWIERNALNNSQAYLIVGIRTLIDPHIVAKTDKGSDVSLDVDLSGILSAAGVATTGQVVPLTDLSLGGGHESNKHNSNEITIPGERIFCLEYRKVKQRWLSSSNPDIPPLQVTQIRQWTCLEGHFRDAQGSDDSDQDPDEGYDDTSCKDEDTIAVNLEEKAEPPGAEWEATEIDGQVAYICIG